MKEYDIRRNNSAVSRPINAKTENKNSFAVLTIVSDEIL